MLVGEPAAAFAREAGLETAPDAWFVTEERRLAFAAGDDFARRDRRRRRARRARGGSPPRPRPAAARGKHPGRVGDSPLIAAGTWADDATAAISCTGDGEAIIRVALSHEIDALMRHAGLRSGRGVRDRALAGLEPLRHRGRDRGRRGRWRRGPVHDARDAARLAGRRRPDRRRRRARWLTSTTSTRSRSRSSSRPAAPPPRRSARPATARPRRSSRSSRSRPRPPGPPTRSRASSRS